MSMIVREASPFLSPADIRRVVHHVWLPHAAPLTPQRLELGKHPSCDSHTGSACRRYARCSFANTWPWYLRWGHTWSERARPGEGVVIEDDVDAVGTSGAGAVHDLQ